MTICNKNSICIDIDCKYYHSINIKDRRVVKKLYDDLISPNKKEDNPETRKANCKFGQICYNEKCGFRHFLNFKDRMKIVDGFNDAKMEMTRTKKVEKDVYVEVFNIPKKNLFDCLENN
jgi:hypothetical protein